MPAVPSLEPLADPTEPAATVTSSVHTSWYDPDASSWEPQPAVQFEALRASTPRPARALGTGRAPAARGSVATRPASTSRRD